jgi:hypothetical protein
LSARRPLEVVEILDESDGSLLDLVDHVLNKGVCITGDVMLGVAGVDLVYLRLQAILAAADRVLPRRDAEGGSGTPEEAA